LSYKKSPKKIYNVSMNFNADYSGLTWQERERNADDAKEKALKRMRAIVRKDLEVEREE